MLAAAPAVLPRLEQALSELQAELIAVPPLRSELLERGHAVHFRCRRPDVAGLRLDLMTKPPRLPDLDATWQRQTVLALDGGPISVVALEDLVATKKTQRDKEAEVPLGKPLLALTIRNQLTRWSFPRGNRPARIGWAHRCAHFTHERRERRPRMQDGEHRIAGEPDAVEEWLPGTDAQLRRLHRGVDVPADDAGGRPHEIRRVLL